MMLALQASAAILKVGPGEQYARPCEAIRAAHSADTIEVDTSGNYGGDVCAWPKMNGLTIRGVGGGRAKIDAAGKNAQGKGIWVITGNDTIVENIELSGARVSSHNGAGIRQEGRNLTVRNCYFHDNEDGILTARTGIGNILVEFSEFAYNGHGDGQSHNMYINHADSFTLRFSYSHHAKVGHLVKSRAAINYILYNRLSDEATGNASYELDLPNGGTSYVIGNVIEQGPNSPNFTIVSYQEEGANPANPGHDLYMVNNTVVNDLPGKGRFVSIDPTVTTPALIRNNIFFGAGTAVVQPGAQPDMSANLNTSDASIFQSTATYDYHLTPNSAATAGGTDPRSAPGGFSLKPYFEYIHPACGETRRSGAAFDVGAYAFGGQPAPVPEPDRCNGQNLPLALLVNGANFHVGAVAPGSVIAVFGDGLADGSAGTPDSPLPRSILGTAVRINGVDAPLFFVSPTQVNAQIPFEVGAGDALVVASKNGADVSGTAFIIAPAAPNSFQLGNDRALVMNQDSSLNDPKHPAPVNTLVVLYLTGQGAVDKPVATGAAAPSGGLSRSVLASSATIGGLSADVLFLGLAPGLVGVAQAQLRVPVLASGNYPVVLTVGGVPSNPVLISVVAN